MGIPVSRAEAQGPLPTITVPVAQSSSTGFTAVITISSRAPAQSARAPAVVSGCGSGLSLNRRKSAVLAVLDLAVHIARRPVQTFME